MYRRHYFPSDADDIWDLNKIEVLLHCYEIYPNTVFAFSDGRIINENGIEIGKSMYEEWGYKESCNNAIKLSSLSLQRKMCAHGMLCCFKKALFEQAEPFLTNIGHDEWLSMISSCFGEVRFVNQPLVSYRRHGSNTSGNRPSIWRRLIEWDREGWFTHADDVRMANEVYLKRYSAISPPELIEIATNQVQFQGVLTKITKR